MSLEKVANYAGVSTATVSRVLNAVPVVRPATVRAVRDALEALKYEPLVIKRGPRPGSRAVRSKNVNMIGLVVIGVNHDRPRSISHEVVESIIHSAKKSGLRLMMDHMPDLTDISSIVRNREVQGAVVMLPDDAPLSVLDEMNKFVPVVWAMGGQAGPVGVDHVSENNYTIGCLAHRYLQSQGCQHMAFLSIVPHKRNALQRGQAFMAAAAQSQHPCRSYILSDPLTNGLYGPEACAGSTLGGLIESLRAPKLPDGLFIDRDATTSWVYPLLLRLGIKPGRDIKIVSCDNDELALSGLSPRPATIDLGIAELASMIVDRLVWRIQNREEPPICLQNIPCLESGEDQIDHLNDSNHHDTQWWAGHQRRYLQSFCWFKQRRVVDDDRWNLQPDQLRRIRHHRWWKQRRCSQRGPSSGQSGLWSNL